LQNDLLFPFVSYFSYLPFA